MKTQICSNMIDTLSNNLSIARRLCLFMCDFICKKPKMNSKNFTQLNQAIQEYTKHTPPNIHRLTQFVMCVMSHNHPYLVSQFSLQFHMTLLPSLGNNSHNATFLMRTSTRKFQVSSKVKCNVCYSIYVFLN